MINAKKSLFMLAACTVLAVTISASTFSAPRVMSAQEEVRQEPLQIEQTETSGVSLAVERVVAAASEIGREEVTATVSPSNALYDLEWSLTVGDSLIPEADMSDYLTIEEKSATTIELVCHQRFDGYAKLHVEDAYTGKTASASVSAWAFSDSSYSYALNGDFEETNDGAGFMYSPSDATYNNGKMQIQAANWNFYTDPDDADDFNNMISAVVNWSPSNDNELWLQFMGRVSGNRVMYITQDVPTYATGGILHTYFLPGSEFYLVIETKGDYYEPYLYGTEDEYTELGCWKLDDNTVVFRFSVNDYDDWTGKMFGFGYSCTKSSSYQIKIVSAQLYMAN